VIRLSFLAKPASNGDVFFMILLRLETVVAL